MKKHFMSVISKLTLGISLFTVLAATGVQAASMGPIDKIANVKYLGATEDDVFFNVSVNNPTAGRFLIILLDEDGNQLFQEVYNDKKFDRRFRLLKPEKHKLTFIVRNFKDADQRDTFEINTSYIENVVVTRL